MRGLRMLRDKPVRHALAVVLLIGVLAGSQGCTYAKYRVQDLLDIADIGVSLSWKPGVALYACFASVAPGGFSYVDGYFLGWGGGRIGFTRHFETCWGLLVIGHEVHGWGDFDKDDTRTLHRQYTGAGIVLFPAVESRPSYMPACVHYFHVLFLGLVGNLRYMEIVDFVLGFTTIDLNGDDGPQIATWPWRSN
jgi:hypothetical protein